MTFPIFQFTVATDDLLDVDDDVKGSDDTNSDLYGKLGTCFLPDSISSEVKKKYGYLLKEITSMIRYIFSELYLALECILISLIYLEKLISKTKVELRASNWRPLLLTSIILATKYWED